MTGSGLPKIVRRRSPLHGYGVFAAEPINKNRRIIDYAGELIRNADSAAREARYLEEGCIWVFRVNRRWSRDAAFGGNIARFINHSCTPNCWWEVVDTTIWIRASRRIAGNNVHETAFSALALAAGSRPVCRNASPSTIAAASAITTARIGIRRSLS